jgi:hypothetical protein
MGAFAGEVQAGSSQAAIFTRSDAAIALPEFGLRCRVSDLCGGLAHIRLAWTIEQGCSSIATSG